MTGAALTALFVIAIVAHTIGGVAGAAARLSGQVVRAHDGGPLRSATVSIESFDGTVRRSVATNASGQFTIADLPPGQFAIGARATGYVEGWWRESGSSRGVGYTELASGEQRHVRIALARGGVITGRVIDADGNPVEGVPIHALISEHRSGRELLRQTAARPRVTDDRGYFRIFGLDPAEYYVAAVPGPLGGHAGGPLPGHALTYFPGVPAISEAVPTSVAADRESAIGDLVVRPVMTAAITGTVSDSRGAPRAGTELVLLPASGPVNSVLPRATSDSAGRLAFFGVPPGNYLLQNLPSPTPPSEFGAVALTVTGNATYAALRMQGDTRALGRIVFEDERPDFAPRQLAVTLQAETYTRSPLARGARARVLDDWSLEMTNIWGPQFLRVIDPPKGWMVRHVYAGTDDFVDRAIDFSRNDLPIRVILTRRGAVINGMVRDQDRAPAPGTRVVIFAADADRWHRDARTVQSTRVDAAGRYQSRPLPPGDYLLAAVNHLSDRDWPPRPSLLEALRTVASVLSVGERRTHTKDLVVAPLPQ